MSFDSYEGISDSYINKLDITFTYCNNNYKEADSFTLFNKNNSFKFIAVGDCCSRSVFTPFKGSVFTSLIDETIIKLEEIEFPEDYNCSEDIEDYSEYDEELCTKTHLYQFILKNKSEPFKFMLVNYSNGYYDGWISIDKN